MSCFPIQDLYNRCRLKEVVSLPRLAVNRNVGKYNLPFIYNGLMYNYNA